MSIICPTVLAENEADYRVQVERVAAFATRIQIDLTDGQFAPSKTVNLDKVWWPHTARADLHIMYQRPMDFLSDIKDLSPNLAIIHAESDADQTKFARAMHDAGIKAGLAILADTNIQDIGESLGDFDHLLIFGGQLGSFGGSADLSLLDKIDQAKNINPGLEFGWDGGANDENAKALAEGGIDVINVGGFIQKSEDPAAAYAKLEALVS